jgi:hypothetical protein
VNAVDAPNAAALRVVLIGLEQDLGSSLDNHDAEGRLRINRRLVGVLELQTALAAASE